MIAEHKILIDEIVEMKSQYQKEITGKRKAWPRSIKERIAVLDVSGTSLKLIADRTGIPYDTILQWRYQRNYEMKKSFHQLEVVQKALPKGSGTVTVPDPKKRNYNGTSPVTVTVPVPVLPKPNFKTGTVTVTTPDGYVIEMVSAEACVLVLAGLRRESVCS